MKRAIGFTLFLSLVGAIPSTQPTAKYYLDRLQTVTETALVRLQQDPSYQAEVAEMKNADAAREAARKRGSPNDFLAAANRYGQALKRVEETEAAQDEAIADDPEVRAAKADFYAAVEREDALQWPAKRNERTPATQLTVASSATQPATQPDDSSFVINDVRISLVGAKVGKVTLDNNKLSDDVVLEVTIRIENLSDTRKFDYRPWRWNAFRDNEKELSDNFGNTYKLKNIVYPEPTGQFQSGTSIYPGKVFTDVLVFEPPVDAAKTLTLHLDKANLDGEGEATIIIHLK